MDRKFLIGIGLTLMGGILWGLSGASSQFLQQQRGITPEWLLVVRLLISGVVTVMAAYWQGHGKIFEVFKTPKDVIGVLVFGLLGMALCQYAYFRSIYYAGAGIATVLQYLAPIIIVLYMAIRYLKLPTWGEAISIVLATIGTAMIALQGKLSLAGIDEKVLFWGLLSAVAVAIYSVQPVSLLRRYGTGPIVGFAMLFSGIIITPWAKPFDVPGEWDMWTYIAFFNVVVLGTIISFNAYLEGVRRIGAVKGSVLSSVEPISAALLGWALLGSEFLTTDIIGFVLILSTIFILAREKSK